MSPEEAAQHFQNLVTEEVTLYRDRELKSDQLKQLERQVAELNQSIHCISQRLSTLRPAIEGYKLASFALAPQKPSVADQPTTS